MDELRYLLLAGRFIVVAAEIGQGASRHDYQHNPQLWDLKLLEGIELLTQMRLEARKGVGDVLA